MKTAARKWIESHNLGLLEAMQLRNELSHWISEWSQEQQDEAYRKMYEIEMANRQNGKEAAMQSKTVSLSWRDVKPSNVWTYEQNKPSLIVHDMEELGVDRNDTARILVARGVAKWLAVRRLLIKAKDTWKSEITERYSACRMLKRGSLEWEYNRGYRDALERCRAEVRSMCHSDRWTSPDFDEKFARLLKEIE